MMPRPTLSRAVSPLVVVALLAAALLAAAGIVDAIENALLLTASGSGSQDTVDTAHALAAPKVLLFVAGAALALATNWRALGVVRGAGSAPR